VKIGKFSETYRLSIDTIRHYMDLGLIVPEKQGGQYFFDSRCQKDLEDILNFKNMGFSLNEIKIVFLYKSLSKLTAYQENLYYRTFFTEKLKKVENDIKGLIKTKERLEDKLEELCRNVDKDNCTFGIDLRVLKLFKCLKCSRDLILYDAAVNSNQVMNGKLKCDCGEEYVIESGILRVGEPYQGTTYKYDDEHIIEYVNNTDMAYLDNLHKGLEWGGRKIKLCNLDNKIILELGTGFGFFLRHIYDELPDDCIYIAVDHSMERHKFLKSMLESSAHKRNIIFICSDFLSVPIKKKSVDIILDISGTSNYGFKHDHFLLDLVDDYIKEDAYLLGSYILFKSFSINSVIDRKYRRNFMLENIKEKIRGLKFKALEENTSDYVDKGGKYENYFVEGEKVYTYSVIAKR